MSVRSVISNDLSKITVCVINKKINEGGTGFILKQSDEYDFGYFFTAKHVILGKNYQSNPDYLNSGKCFVDKKELSLYLDGREIFLYGDEIFYLDIDIAFGIVKLSENSLENLKKIKVSDYDFSSNYKYNFYAFGYPSFVSKEYGDAIELDFTREVSLSEQKELVFSSKRNLGSTRINKTESNISTILGGLSGGGIFLNKESDYLHVNSLIIKADGFTSIIALNLLEQINKINGVFIQYNGDENIPRLEMNQFFEFDDEHIKLECIDYEKFKEKIGDIDETEFSLYKNSRKIIDHKRNLENERKKLAKFCVKLALSYNENKEYHLSTRYFKHAIDLDESYKPLFLLSKNNRSKYNEAIIKTTDDVLMTRDINYETQYELIKQKILALDDNKKNQYEAILEFFNIKQNVNESEFITHDVENYLCMARDIINCDIEISLKNNKNIFAENYLYMAEVSKTNKSFYHSVYFLYAARDLVKFIYNKNQPIDEIEYANEKLTSVLSDESFDRSIIFKAQIEAEEKIRSFEKIKKESDAILFNDVKDILQKLNDIYDKSNDSGILQEISQTIDSISKKINPDAHNQDTSSSDMQDEEKPNKKTGFGLRSVGLGLFIDVFLFIGMVGFLTGSAVNTVIG